jgi:hypothetical protein
MFIVFGPLWFVIIMTAFYLIFKEGEREKVILKLLEYVGGFLLGLVMISFIVWIILCLTGYSTK